MKKSKLIEVWEVRFKGDPDFYCMIPPKNKNRIPKSWWKELDKRVKSQKAIHKAFREHEKAANDLTAKDVREAIKLIKKNQ